MADVNGELDLNKKIASSDKNGELDLNEKIPSLDEHEKLYLNENTASSSDENEELDLNEKIPLLDENEELDLNEKIASSDENGEYLDLNQKVDEEYFDLYEKIHSLEREKEFLLRKVEELEASGNHQRVELQAKEREIGGLKRTIEEQDGALFTSSELAKRAREEMLTKISELENKLEIQENERLSDLNEKVDESSGVNEE
ncbi:uncharacterized protein LOC132045077 [Lycium ferocissimum]|uniref:uncharacterized protein LOC132045077 n=1 Tax=Lycium ferocissimum TaxID=112874 RepID=UPI0028157A42|nr:uncharacterized protein LOC132045077 [Lycium ferocissimum]